MALKVKVSKIGLLDMKKFSQMPEVREKAIAEAPAIPLPSTYKSNSKAEIMHPEKQTVIIDEIRRNGPDANTYVLKAENGGMLAPFRAGQFISVAVDIGQTKTTRSYSLCGSPAWAFDGIYNITVKRDDSGFVSPYILDNWRVGQKVIISAPEGHLYYNDVRDCKKVLALAGGSGITPFMGMAYAIRDGFEDFDLTVIFGSRTENSIVYRKELDAIVKECPKVHVVHVLSDEEKAGYEHGFVTADIIKKYAGNEEVSIFMCGPQAMYKFLDGEIAKLGYDLKHVRRELFGTIKDPWNQPGYPQEKKDCHFKAHIQVCGKEYDIETLANEPLLVAIERAGIVSPSRCRSGECGWCRSRLLSGDVYIPEITDGRRWAEKEYGYIHPCSSFPLSDVSLEVPGEYLRN